ncbi:MAG: NFACT family protein [Clostridia bacterium]|nr:NFACT family protein [Clostridia bacterium]
MAYDAIMMGAIANEISSLGTLKVEKVYQPVNDEIVLMLRSMKESYRLLINAGSNYPRLNFTSTQSENPAKAPMFCMLLRKHLAGAKLLSAYQEEFERVCFLELEAYDEMGFKSKKYLICEIMGKYSNLILTDTDKKIISALKLIDFSTSTQRQILPGLTYEMPPKQDKLNPLGITREEFKALYDKVNKEMKCDKFITNNFMGMALSTARQIAYTCGRNIDITLENVDFSTLSDAFFDLIVKAKSNTLSPYLVSDKNGAPIEYSYTPIEYFGTDFICEKSDSFSQAVDAFYYKKSKNEKIRQKSSDILRLLTNAENRIVRKISLQTSELEKCEESEELKLFGDLITANIYMMKRGAASVTVCNYYDENCPNISIPLDTRLSPSQNAQAYYKKYNKAKKAKIELTKQIALAKEELEYIGTVFDALSKAETESDLNEIRDEIYHSGYASRMKNYTATKQNVSKPLKFVTSGGYTLYCGKNNKQNDYVTTKLSEKTDWWFHAKNVPGSHVLMQCNGEEPSEKDFTEAAEVAAFYSKAEGNNIAVDYTLGKHVKKPAGSKPGFVVYNVNWTAYVTPSEEKIEKMKIK